MSPPSCGDARRLKEGRLRIFVRYLLLEAPGWLLAALVAGVLYEQLDLSGTLVAVVLAAWIAKDLALYPWLRNAIVGEAPTEAEKLVGATAVVERAVDPVGHVRLGSELWRAEAKPREVEIPRGRRVRVAAVRGLTLIVRDSPEGEGGEPQS